MMKTTKTTQSKNYSFASVCKDYSTVNTRMTFITFQNLDFNSSLERFLIIIDYVQLISQIILLHYSQWNNSPDQQEPYIMKEIMEFVKLMTPEYWVFLNDNQAIVVGILLFVAFFSLIKYLFFLYMMVLSSFDIGCERRAIIAWKLLFRVQNRVLYFTTTSFWVKVILDTSQDNFSNYFTDLGKIGNIAVSAISIGTELIFSLFLQLRYCYILPNKSFSSSLDNQIEILTLIQKFMMQLLKITLKDSLILNWSISPLNLVFSAMCLRRYFTTLPYHHMRALKLQGALLVTVSTLSLSCFVEVVLQNLGYPTNIVNMIIIWILAELLGIKVLNGCLNKIIFHLLSNKNYNSPELLICKINLIKHMKKTHQLPSDLASKHNFLHLMSSTIDVDLNKILNLNIKSQENVKKDPIKSPNHVFVQYLENLTGIFPKNGLIKLYLAYFYAKKLHTYASAIKMITEIKNQCQGYKIHLNASLLIHEMQKLIKTQGRNVGKIDLVSYIENITRVAKLKGVMLNQAGIQKQLYEEILKENSDLGRILDSAQAANRQRIKMEQKIMKSLAQVQDFCLEPLAICTHYFLSLNYNINESMNYYKKYLHKMSKYRRYLQSEELVQENLYQANNIFILLSVQKSDAGKIIYCSKSIENTLGGDVRTYIGMNVSNIIAPCLYSLFEKFYKSFIDKHEDYLGGGTSIRGYICHQDGYIVEADLFLDVHPLLTQGLCLGLILRPIPASKEILVVNQNGDIDCATRGISQKLNLPFHDNKSFNLKVNINLISDELSQVNNAFNVIALSSKNVKNEKTDKTFETRITEMSSRISFQTENIRLPFSKKLKTFEAKLSYQEASELCHIFSSKGKNILLNALNQNNKVGSLQKSIPSFCQVKSLYFGSTLVKVVTLYIKEGQFLNDLSIYVPKTPIGCVNNIRGSPSNYFSMCKCKSDCENFGSEDEKQDGWIDFNTLHQESISKKMISSDNESCNALNAKNRKDQPSSLFKYDQGISTQAILTQNKKATTNIASKNYPSESVTSSLEEIQNINRPTKKSLKVVSKQNSFSKVSHEKCIANSYMKALETNYYPKYLQIFYTLLYFSLVFTLGSQIKFKTTMSEGISELKTIKDVVSNAEMRNHLLIKIQQSSRYLFEAIIENADEDNLENREDIEESINEYLSDLKDNLVKLLDTSQELALGLNFLNGENFKSIFEKDIRLFESNFDDTNEETFISVNNFQATESLVQFGLRAINKMKLNLSESQADLFFVLNNTLNDIHIKNEAVSDIFMASLDEEGTKVTEVVKFYIFSVFVIAIALTIVFLVIIMKDFKRENKVLEAVAKFDSLKIRTMLKMELSFTETLENESHFFEEEKSLEIALGEINKIVSVKQNMKLHTKMPKSKGIKKKYYCYAARFILFMIFLVASVIFNMVSGGNTISFFQKCQDQLYFTERLRSQIGLAGSLSNELLVENGTTLIHNNPIPTQLEISMKQLDNMKIMIPKVYIWENSSYDPEIEVTLFSDGCFYLQESNQDEEENEENKENEGNEGNEGNEENEENKLKEGFALCNKLKEASIQTDVISLLNLLESMINQKKENLEISKDSPKGNRVLKAESSDNIMMIVDVLLAEVDSIVEDIEGDLEISLDQTDDEKNKLFAAFCVFLFALGLLVWVCLLKEFKENNNKLKKLLQVFPAHLVLSNFMLKRYLLETTHGTLNFIKNEI